MGIVIELPEEHAKHPNAPLLVYWMADLLFRMYDDVAVSIDESTPAPFDREETLEAALVAMREAIPLPGVLYSSDRRLVVSPVQNPDVVTVWSDGWTIWCNTDAEVWHDWNPLSTAAAACIGAASTVEPICGDPGRALMWSVRTRTPLPDRGTVARELTAPPTFVAGVGAVGCAFVQVLRSFAISGEYRFADNQPLSLTNLRRYAGTRRQHVGTGKAELASTTLKNLGAAAKGFQRPAQESFPDFPLDGVLVSAVDTAPGRRALAENLPPIVFDAALSDDEARLEVLRSSFPPAGACLACFYPRVQIEMTREEELANALGLSLDEVKMLRATGAPLSPQQLTVVANTTGRPIAADLIDESIDTLYTRHYCGGPAKRTADAITGDKPMTKQTGEEVDWTPVPALAGVLLATDYILYCNGWSRPENFFTWDLAAPPNPDMDRFRKADPTCHVCADEDFAAVFHAKMRGSN